jgi:hypothetical protein
MLGATAMMSLGLPGALAAMVWKPLGAFLTDALGDAFGVRENEEIRDMMEAALGYFSGRQAYQGLMPYESWGLFEYGTVTPEQMAELIAGLADAGAMEMHGYTTAQIAAAISAGSEYSPGDFFGTGQWNAEKARALDPAAMDPVQTGWGNDNDNDNGGGFSGDTPGGADDGYGRRYGGFSDGPRAGYPMTLHGAEEVVPLDEPYRSKFRDAVGMDPAAIAAAIVQQLGGAGGGNNRPIHVTVNLGNETLGTYVAQIADNVRIEATRRDAGTRRII